MLESLWRAGLTTNTKKCAVGRGAVGYLGYHLGGGQVHPQVDKTVAIVACPIPKTKKEVRQFLGLAGYYRRFILRFVDLTSSMTDLTRKAAPDPVCGRSYASWHLRGSNKPSAGSLSSTHLTSLSLSSCRPMLRTGGWGQCCLSRCWGRTAQCCTSAGSCPRGSLGTAPTRRSAWLSSGRLALCGITCWGSHSPSARTMLPSSDSIA